MCQLHALMSPAKPNSRLRILCRQHLPSKSTEHKTGLRGLTRRSDSWGEKDSCSVLWASQGCHWQAKRVRATKLVALNPWPQQILSSLHKSESAASKMRKGKFLCLFLPATCRSYTGTFGFQLFWGLRATSYILGIWSPQNCTWLWKLMFVCLVKHRESIIMLCIDIWSD